MKNIYACLVGEWVCLNDDPECRFIDSGLTPYEWWESGAEIWSPRNLPEEHSMYYLNYVNIYYKGKEYRINPAFIQVVTE